MSNRIIYNDSHSSQFIDRWLDNKDYIEAYTSGSTGAPKSVKLLKVDMEASARSTCEFFGINEKSILVCPLSAEYIAGKMMIVRSFVSGSKLYMEQPSNAPLTDTYSYVDLVAIVPSQIAGLLENISSINLKNVIIGGAPMTINQEKMLYHQKFKAYSTYGMTETCSHVALREIKPGNNLYTALPGYTFDTDHRSCLVINSSVQTFKSIVTNDIVSLKDDSNFEWEGRFDNVIISGGIKIFPEEIEKKIVSAINRPFYLIGAPHEKWGQELVLVIECSELDTEALLDTLKLILPPYHRPHRIIFKERFQRTKSGKIKRVL